MFVVEVSEDAELFGFKVLSVVLEVTVFLVYCVEVSGVDDGTSLLDVGTK